MLLEIYQYASEKEKEIFLKGIPIEVGLKYFGGKTFVARKLINYILNMAVEASIQNKRADVFIDAFVGGGKVGLSIPKGWFKTIVINDLDYGVYCFYKMCKEKPEKLIYAIDKLGQKMCKDLFDGLNEIRDDKSLDPLMCAAATHWVSQASYSGQMGKNASYILPAKESKELGREKGKSLVEKENIRKIMKSSPKRIKTINKLISDKNIIIENLDYKELIRKYEKRTLDNKIADDYNVDLGHDYENILWYFDPPYHPYTLHGGMEAPYPCTFTIKQAEDFVKVLLERDKEVDRKLDFFIKSDYDPKEAIKIARDSLEKGKKSQKDWFKKLLELEEDNNEVSRSFEELEVYPYMKKKVGSFRKGAVDGMGEITFGSEYIWCKGFKQR